MPALSTRMAWATPPTRSAHPYLWRFWRRMPRRGQLAILDRSWYGQVREERLEGYCNEYDWMRA